MDENIKDTRGHLCRLLKTRCTRDIAICWINGRWMLLASMLLSLD